MLIDVLIKTGGGANPSGKLSSILDSLTYATDPPALLRHNLLIWLDTMGILQVNFQSYSYQLIRPVWVKTAIEGKFILMGALTMAEQEGLVKLGFKAFGNVASYPEMEIEMPNSFYSYDEEKLLDTDFEIIKNPLFNCAVDQFGYNEIIQELTKHSKVGFLGIDNKLVENDSEYWVFSMPNAINDGETLFFSQSDKVEKFNWRNRLYERCDIVEELHDQDGCKLIRYSQESFGGLKRHTILLERYEENAQWKYYYFDTKLVDERWARVIYLGRETRYDIHYDIRRAGIENDSNFEITRGRFNLQKNVLTYRPTSTPFYHEYLSVDENATFLIPDSIKKSVLLYDKENSILAIPKRLPLPTVFMRCLFSCSGKLPRIFNNKFLPNANYPMKLVFNGKVSENGTSLPYPNERYFTEEDFYMFPAVPIQLLEVVSQKLGLAYTTTTFIK